jgi:hypothetical protein
MVKLNILLIMAILPIALVVLSGAASASGTATVQSVTFTVDSIHANGHYIGVPALIPNTTEQYGYNYTFVFDGSYTIFGHATNSANTSIQASVDAYEYNHSGGAPLDWEWDSFTIPAATNSPGEVYFSVSVKSLDMDFDSIGYVGTVDHSHPYAGPHAFLFGVGDENSIITNEPDTTTHTVAEGPMSNMSIVYTSEEFNSNPGVQYSINQSNSNMFFNGKFNFNNSSLYAFAE